MKRRLKKRLRQLLTLKSVKKNESGTRRGRDGQQITHLRRSIRRITNLRRAGPEEEWIIFAIRTRLLSLS
jgi:hypothetical protein